MPEALGALREQWRTGIGTLDPDLGAKIYIQFWRAAEYWYDAVLRVCEEFWHPDDFPHGLGDQAHPAAPFVAGCFLYQVLLMDEELVFSYPLQVERYPNHPDDRERDPVQVIDKAKIKFIEGQLNRVALEGRGATNSEINSWISRLAEVGFEAARPIFAGDYDNERKGWFCVSLVPEMTSLDWREAESSVLRRVREIWGDDFVGSRIRFWHDQGKSNGWIARQLGINSRTVAVTLRQTTISDA